MQKSDMLTNLKENGFLVEEAMRYCAGVESIYREVLKSALEEGEEKLPLLERCIKEKNFERYRIEVHGIKNVAQMIGATSLYEKANAQNEATKAGDYESALQNHNAFMEVYRQGLDLIKKILGENYEQSISN